MATLDEQIAAMAERQHGLVTSTQLSRLGASKEAIRHRREKGLLLPLRPGVLLVSGAPQSTMTRLLAAVLAAGPGACASHRTAAFLYRLPGYRERPIDVTVPRGRRPRINDVNVHSSRALPASQRRTVDAIPTTSVARLLFDLCGFVDPRRVERTLDAALARRLVTIPACWRVISDVGQNGRAGTGVMRELLEARGDGYVAPASDLEARLLRLLRDAGLPAPAREIDVGDSDRWIGRVELVYREARLLIEGDSRLHHSQLLDQASDNERDNRFGSRGWRVLRFGWKQITEHPDEVAALVRAALSVPSRGLR